MRWAAGPEERRQDRALALLALAGVVLACVAMLVAADQPAVILLVWVPVAGAALLDPRRVALLGLGTVVLGLAILASADGFDTADRTFRVVALVGAALASVWLSVLRAGREERLARMTHVAHVAQRAVIRGVPPVMGDVRLAARYLSATEEALIGGDLFEVAMTPHGFRVVVGDVRGKGLPAVEVASVVLSTFRVAAFTEPELRELAARMDEAVRREIVRTGDDENFVTAVVVEIAAGGRSSIVACGHHPPLLLDGEPRAVPVEQNPPLGLGPAERVSHTRWPVGGRVLLYTDGLVEARDADGRFFPLEDGLRALERGDPEDSLDALVAQLMAHAGGRLADDLALLLLEIGAPTPPPVAVQDGEQGTTR